MENIQSTITNEEMDLIRRVYQVLSASPKFRKKTQQRQLIGFAGNILSTGNIGIAEAPTGIGKTISYLVSGIAASIVREKRLIVSTATVALQNQIMLKDILTVTSAYRKLGYEVDTSLMKGRERYVCNVKLFDMQPQHDMFNQNVDADLIHTLQDDIETNIWDGELETTSRVIPITLWNDIKSDRHSCNGEQCPAYHSCGYYKNVIHAKRANVIVANHSLVLSGMMYVPNSLYAEFDKNLYVFDEGHHIAEKANSIFASTINSEMGWLNNRMKLYLEKSSAPSALRTNSNLQCTVIVERMKAANRYMQTYSKNNMKMIRFKHGEIPESIKGYLLEIQVALKSLMSNQFDFIDSKGNLTRKDKLDYIAFKGNIEETMVAIQQFTEHHDNAPVAKWAEQYGKEWRFMSSPFDAGNILYHKIWKHALEKKSGILITSATLATDGKFDHILREIGLRAEQSKTLRLSTPYAEAYSKVRLTVPRMRFMPENVEGHTKEVLEYVKYAFEHTDGGILVLFASSQQMKDVYEGMSEAMQSSILMQGMYGFNEIIESHFEHIQNNMPSMIFGLATFAEGVDLPGLLCTRVIITKIPFPSPEEPLIAAACEWNNKRQDNSAFAMVMIPKAVMRFKQSIGRLVRSEDDYGRIDVLDRRLLEKSYGKRLIGDIPLTARYA